MHLGIPASEWHGYTDEERYRHLKSLYRHFVRHVGHVLSAFPGHDGDVIVDQDLYFDVVSHYYEDLGRWPENNDIHPDDLKQKAIYAFWIRKIKPISLTNRAIAFGHVWRKTRRAPPFSVIAGLDPAIQSGSAHALPFWIPGSSPGMTRKDELLTR